LIKIRNNFEKQLQYNFTEKILIERGWFAKSTHGNAYQSGFPDVFATHNRFGHRWIEFKIEPNYQFTPAQIDTFPKLSANGSGIWIITAATEDQYLRLFKPQNWYHYLK
jgi:hypothetical protein